MTTDVHFEDEARAKLLEGAKQLYEAVKTTLGPKGRNVIIAHDGETPTVTHDGVTVAKAVNVRDVDARSGAELIKAAASKMNDDVGDGTTTVTVLTYHLMKEAKALIDKGANPMQLSREIEAALEGVIAYLAELKQPADDVETLAKIASLSAADETLGRLIAETVHKVGKAGTISVEFSAKLETEAEIGEGFHIDSGYASVHMATDENRGVAQYDKPAIVVVNKTIGTFMEILPLLSKIDEAGIKEAVIFANDFGEDALANFVLNTTRGTFKTLAVRAPWFEERQRAILEDIAAATGAMLISDDTVSLANADMDQVGRAEKVLSTVSKTTMVGTAGDVPGLLKTLEAKRKTAEGADKDHLELRIAAIAGQVATIRVGGRTENEIEERKFRVDDAVAAAKAALESGILPGGATALYRAPVVGDTKGAELLRKALKEPFKQLMANSNIELAEAEKLLDDNKWHGINVRTGKAVDLKATGIIDPYKVTEQALTTAVSLGVIGMTAGALIVENSK